MVKAINFFGTAGLIALLNFVLMVLFNTAFIEMSVLAGLIAIVFIRLFTSPSNYAKVNRPISISRTETVQFDEQKVYAYPALILYASFFYTLLFLILTIVTYYDYF
ncbi:hypothetical protein [Jeotgalibacillus proteolyticus]|uniref:DUF3899 domain-containing protein n=1 Tax=Jeotgalibacillus proteolyticus TaxID=2082395 RepID=A0A2S5GG39_9BACL|nr:hypothetical protein [Jeotgalibacillus proteolyticus]PPA71881.1 hypothetical protein C4B60_00435 [Jeotgalibacillus proteolyticus]